MKVVGIAIPNIDMFRQTVWSFDSVVCRCCETNCKCNNVLRIETVTPNRLEFCDSCILMYVT